MRPEPPSCSLIGIGGGSASGKSLLAEALVQHTQDAALLRQDAYYHSPLPPTTNFDHPNCIDWSLLLRHVQRLADGQPVQVPHYDFALHRRLPQRETWLHPARVLFIEGLHVLGIPTLQPRLHMAVYVDVPADVRLLRRIRRDVEERGRTVESVLHQYESTVRPMHERYVAPTATIADLMVDGTLPVGDNVAIVRAAGEARDLFL
ncbi:MAG: uridine kinase [Myxococcota bacterium]